MLERADKIGALSQASATELDSFRSALDAECVAGNLDSCFVASELRPAPMFTTLSDTPGADNRKVGEKATYLLDLCSRHQRSACHRLGELVYVFSRSKDVHSLSAEGGLGQTIEQALESDRIPASARKDMAGTAVSLVKEYEEPSPRVMRQWLQSCLTRNASACLLGAAFQWRPAGPGAKSLSAEPELKAQRTLGVAFQRYCPKFPSICARGAWHMFGFNDGPSLKPYRPEIQRLCAGGNADACDREAVALSYEKDRPAEYRLYEKACNLGSTDACANLVEPTLTAGDAEHALGLALAGCQSSNPFDCFALVEKFGTSRDFTSPATGRRLVARACEKGLPSACYRAASYAFQDGDIPTARKVFGRMCASEENLHACRAAAQIAWSQQEFDTARALLRRGCLEPEINSCIELATFEAGQSERGAALRELDRWIEEEHNSSSHLRLLRQRIAGGFQPKRLGEIFQDPIDGTEYFLRKELAAK